MTATAMAVSCHIVFAEDAASVAPSTTEVSSMETVEQSQTTKKASWTPEARQRYMMHRFGGLLFDTRRQKGKVAIVNAQSSASSEWLKEAADIFAKDVMITLEVVPGSFSFPKPELRGEVTVFIVDDPAMPMSLAALEEHWAMVNVALLKTDKTPFFKARVMKMATRAIALLLGGADSQYPLCLMGNVNNVTDIDKFMDSRLPVDVVDRFKKNMPPLGIRPYEITTYRKACDEGWAPAPTNEYQKVIYEKAKAEQSETPTNPITIKPGQKPKRQ